MHYLLLNIPGLVRNDRTRLRYENTAAAYDDVTNMLTRLRLDGSVPSNVLSIGFPYRMAVNSFR